MQGVGGALDCPQGAVEVLVLIVRGQYDGDPVYVVAARQRQGVGGHLVVRARQGGLFRPRFPAGPGRDQDLQDEVASR